MAARYYRSLLVAADWEIDIAGIIALTMQRMLGRAVIWMLGALAVVYVGDWAVWRVRMSRGGGMGTVSVGTMIETPLKGNKMEYDWGGTADVDCSRSIFPQAGSGACWWLRKHPVLDEK